MSKIYEPNGAAREYSPLALNYYKGCDHGCKYCYVPGIMRKIQDDYDHSHVIQRETFDSISKSAAHFNGTDKQVLLSFTGDPYCNFNTEAGFTRQVLEILLENKIPVAILTKGGNRCLADLDLFKQFGKRIKVGATLTFDNDHHSLQNEPGAATPTERLEALKTLHDNGITTWVSMEPVVFPDQSLNMIKRSLAFVDHYKIGKLNHYKNYELTIDWSKFLNDSVTILRSANKLFYVKNDLAKFKNGTVLNDFERDMNFLNL